MGNYIKIDRKILEWEWWHDINTHRLFTYMLLKANWKDGRFKGIEVPRGSFVSSISKLSEQTSLTVNEVRTALKHLKETDEITSNPHGKFTVFTVKNYCLYQDNNEQSTSRPQASHKQTTSKSQPINELLTTIEEEKERETGKQDKQGSRECTTPPLPPSQGEEEEKPKRENQKQLLERLLLEVYISDYLLEYIKSWLEYKKERNRFTYKEKGLRTLLKTASEKSKQFGDDAVAKAIDESISSGYQGIIWDKLSSGRRKEQSGDRDVLSEWRNS